MSTLDDGHGPHHKCVQHDADADGDPGELITLEEAYADALTPEEYVLSSEQAMRSAIEQQAILDGEPT